MTTSDDAQALADLNARILTLLPATYQASYETLQPIAMRTAGLVYAADGSVAWDKIWGSFCDLAMAGGPPHKGRLLEPASPEAIAAQPDRYDQVTAEIRRGVSLATNLVTRGSPLPGWIRADCYSEAMAGWLLRAIAMENVAVHADGRWLSLPAGPDYRLEKEIKNVVTVIAKTTHYWVGHMLPRQQFAVAELLAAMNAASPVLTPPTTLADSADAALAQLTRIAARLETEIGIGPTTPRQAGWVGVECPNVAAAVWLTRALVATNVLARREGTTLCVPANRVVDPWGDRVVHAVARVYRLALVRAAG